MRVRYLDSFRKRYYEVEMHWNRKLRLQPLPYDLINERHKKLNDSNFKSEMWFKSYLDKIEFSTFRVLDVRRNYPILNRYFADFYILDLNLVIEIDGSSHDETYDYDKRRDELFRSRQLKVIRIKYLDDKRAEEIVKLISNMQLNKKSKALSKKKIALLSKGKKHKHKKEKKFKQTESNMERIERVRDFNISMNILTKNQRKKAKQDKWNKMMMDALKK